MKRCLLILLFSTCFFLFGYAQDTLTYNIYFPNAVHHEAEISLQVTNINENKLTAIMSKSSPGRYAVHNFAKNVYRIHAFDEDNTEISIKRYEPDQWQFSGINNSLTISYTLYANHADGTYSGIDASFANLNMPATLMWIKGMEEHPVKVIFNLPDTGKWKVATQLLLIDSSKNTYAAPNLQYLMDSPCMLSDFTLRKLEEEKNDGYRFQMAINAAANKEEIDQFVSLTQAVIREQKLIFGEFPQFMDSTYTFLCSYGLGFYGDGMEHRNSTMIASMIPLSGNQHQLIGSVSHEFFHVWNIERIRPASLEPFNFTQANISRELWFGEGFTSYYGDLTLCRSGVINKDRYLNSVGILINYFINSPGWKYGSPVAMSEMAPYTDRAVANDETNFENTFFSYYDYGEVIGLALDLTLRTEFEDKSLDDLMKAMWQKFGKGEKPYANIDIQQTLAEISEDEDFAEDFFDAHIFGNDIPDFAGLFDKFGYKLVKKNPGRPSLGFVRLRFDGDTATLLSQPLIESALYEAGVNKGDLILSIDGQPVTSYPELNFIVGTRKIGDEIDISFSHHGNLIKTSFKLKEDNQLVLIPKEKFSIRVTEEEKALRAAWLNSKGL